MPEALSSTQARMREFEYQTEVLSNGLRLLLYDLPHRDTVYIGAFLPGGPVYERTEHAGVSHLLEHLHLTSTRKFASDLELWRKLSHLTASAGGATAHDAVCFNTVCGQAQATDTARLLADILEIRPFRDDEIRSEKRVLNSEYAGGEADRFDFAMQQNRASCASASSYAEFAQRIQNLDGDTIHAYQRALFQPRQIRVVISGDINGLDRPAIRGAFGQLSGSSDTELSPMLSWQPPRKRYQAGAQSGGMADLLLLFITECKLPRHIQLALSFIADALVILAAPLRHQLIQEPLSVYAFDAQFQSVHDLQVFSIGMQCPVATQDQAIRMTLECCALLRNGAMDADWLECARARSIQHLRWAADNIESAGMWIGYGATRASEPTYSTFRQYLERLNAVTPASVAEAVRCLMDYDNLMLWYAPRKRLGDQSRIRRIVRDALG
ncbi:MAG: insulinase family protein [Phycisphaerales bacterium]|nr:insulinase family protein [Phycisphaerales bacterium]